MTGTLASDHPKGASPGVLRAVLFDMDGTVIDTEPLWFEAEKHYVAKYGKEWAPADALALVGTSGANTTQQLRRRAGSTDSHEVIFACLMRQMLASLAAGEAKPRPGILELVAQLREAGVVTALVTSSAREMVEEALKWLPPGSFDTVVCAQDVVQPKPNPEPYVTAMDRLGVPARDCVVIEDSPSGIASGLAANARVVAIPCMLRIPASPALSRVESAADLDVPRLARICGGETIDDLAASA